MLSRSQVEDSVLWDVM